MCVCSDRELDNGWRVRPTPFPPGPASSRIPARGIVVSNAVSLFTTGGLSVSCRACFCAENGPVPTGSIYNVRDFPANVI